MDQRGSAFAPTVLRGWSQRQNLVPGLALVALAAAGWSYVASHSSATGMASMTMGGTGGAVVFLVGWTAMMTAMMVPATLPLILLYRTTARNDRRPTQSQISMVVLLAGYLAVWAAAGIPVYAYSLLVEPVGSLGIVLPAALLVVGGSYQFTPLKRRCHVRCSSPLFFLLQHWRQGPAGALRLGVMHGADDRRRRGAAGCVPVGRGGTRDAIHVAKRRGGALLCRPARPGKVVAGSLEATASTIDLELSRTQGQTISQSTGATALAAGNPGPAHDPVGGSMAPAIEAALLPAVSARANKANPRPSSATAGSALAGT